MVCCFFFLASILLWQGTLEAGTVPDGLLLCSNISFCLLRVFAPIVCGAAHSSTLLHIESPFFYLTVDACALFSRPLFFTAFKRARAAFKPTNSLFQKLDFHECFLEGSGRHGSWTIQGDELFENNNNNNNKFKAWCRSGCINLTSPWKAGLMLEVTRNTISFNN